MSLSGKFLRDAEPGTYQDTENLFLVLDAKGGRNWIFKYKIKNKSYEIVMNKNASLAKARVEAMYWRKMLDIGCNPLEIIESEKENQKRADKEFNRVATPILITIAAIIFSLFWFYDPIDYIINIMPSMHSDSHQYPASWSVEERMRYDNLPAWEKTTVDQRLREREALCSASREC